LPTIHVQESGEFIQFIFLVRLCHSAHRARFNYFTR